MEAKNKIANVLEFFTNELAKAISETQKRFDSKIILGYHSFKFKHEVERIDRANDALNAIVRYYQQLFNVTVDSTNIAQVLDQILKLTIPSEIMYQLKEMYINHYKIEIPNFPKFKTSVLIEAYDFNKEHLEIMDSIEKAVVDIHGMNVSKEYLKYFSDGEFAISEEQKGEILEGYTVYASTKQLAEIMSLHLMCEGLSNLSIPGYSFKQLPEIPIYLMRKIKIDQGKYGEEGISVDIDAINNARDGDALTGVNQNPNGGFRMKRAKKEY